MDDDEQPGEPTPDDELRGHEAGTDDTEGEQPEGEQADGGQAEPEGDGPEPGDDAVVGAAAADDGRMSRGRLAVLVGSLLVALVVIAFLALRSDDPAPVATTVSVPSTSTTTTVAPWPATEARVAAAKGPTILVQSAPPPEWESASPVEVWSATPLPASQATTPPRDALPASTTRSRAGTPMRRAGPSPTRPRSRTRS